MKNLITLIQNKELQSLIKEGETKANNLEGIQYSKVAMEEPLRVI